jgi:hypothetical protein
LKYNSGGAHVIAAPTGLEHFCTDEYGCHTYRDLMGTTIGLSDTLVPTVDRILGVKTNPSFITIGTGGREGLVDNEFGFVYVNHF